MSETSQNNQENQEIDLSQFTKSIGQFFGNILTTIFRGFLFFKRNIILVGILFIIGASLGFYLDYKDKVYDNEIIVIPNFGSVDYLYAKVELIDSKLKSNDTVFLKEVVGIKKPKKFIKIEVKPINNVYQFIESKPENFELIKLLAEEGDIKKIVDEELTSKNYPYHLISFTTIDETSNEKTLEPLLKFLNESDYYTKVQTEYINNIKIKTIENDSIIKQINGIINTFSASMSGNQKSDKLVYYNENSQLNEIISTKNAMIAEQGSNRLTLINLDKIIKDNSVTLNIRNKEGVNGKLKLILPMLLIGLFVLIRVIRSFYLNQMEKLKS
jgi:hypothetical protein